MAQIAAVALIIDYIVTVAVQTAAGTDAVTSAFPASPDGIVEITIGVVAVMCYGNLRGIREAGQVVRPAHLPVRHRHRVARSSSALIRAALGQLHAPPDPVHAGVVPARHARERPAVRRRDHHRAAGPSPTAARR